MEDDEEQQPPEQSLEVTDSVRSSESYVQGSKSELEEKESGPVIPIRPVINISKRREQPSTWFEEPEPEPEPEPESEPEPEPEPESVIVKIRPPKKLKKKPQEKMKPKPEEKPKPKPKPKPKMPIQTEQEKIEEKKLRELEKQREERKIKQIKQETKLNKESIKEKDPVEFLKAYLESMAYKIPNKAPKTTLEELARPLSRNIRELENYEEIFYPKEKVKRIKEMVKEASALTTEQLEETLRKERKKSELAEKKKKLREKFYIKTLKRLEDQCKSQIMNEIIDKFINYVSEKSINYEIPNMTETMQKLSMVIKKYIFLILAPKTCLWQCDQSALDTLSIILSELMLQALYLTRKYEKDPSCEQQMDSLFIDSNDDYQEKCKNMYKFTEDMYKCLQERSWIAAERNIKRITIKQRKKKIHKINGNEN